MMDNSNVMLHFLPKSGSPVHFNFDELINNSWGRERHEK